VCVVLCVCCVVRAKVSLCKCERESREMVSVHDNMYNKMTKG
jgi:hypothetical protein